MKKIIVGLLLSVAISCAPAPDIPPAGIIPQDTMISLLAEVHIAESRILLSGEFVNNQQAKSVYMHQVLLKFGVDTVRFNQSFSYYTSRPDQFELMYEQVMEEISKQQAAAMK